MSMRKMLTTAAVVGAVLIAAPSYADASPLTMSTTYYSPQFYQGYVVYFDSYGQPYYFINGTKIFVPRCHLDHGRLVRHYRVAWRPYNRWYRWAGWRFKRYRRAYVSAGYHPMCYGSHVVYYDDTGYPYYYNNGAVYHVPQTYARYRGLRRHYRLHRTKYRRWHRRRAPRRIHSPRRHHRLNRRVVTRRRPNRRVVTPFRRHQRVVKPHRVHRRPFRRTPVRRTPVVRRRNFRPRTIAPAPRIRSRHHRRTVLPRRPVRHPRFRPTIPARRFNTRATTRRGRSARASNRRASRGTSRRSRRR